VTRDEAVELAVFIYGGLVFCERCNREPFDEYMSESPGREYDDLEYGQWLLAHGWRFEWEEHDHEGGSGSGKFPFMWYAPERPDGLSWSFTFTCPECGRAAAAVTPGPP
jgi:hypothetical protein